MLCPEVWKFAPPQSNYKELKGNSAKFPSELKDFHFAHLVSVVVPSTDIDAQKLQKCLSADLDYYKVQNISLSDICHEEFIRNFIRNGTLSALSINTNIDTDNCVALTSKGSLVLSLNRKSYQELGLQGKVSHFSSNKKERYIVHINLKHEQFTKNKKLYKRTRDCLAQRLETFTLILSWQPGHENICPSSVAKYLAGNGVKIFLCSPKCELRLGAKTKVPLIEDTEDFMGSDLVEWLGMFSLECDVKRPNEYLSKYEIPENNKNVEEMHYLEYRGFFTSTQIEKMHSIVLKYVQEPWTSINVQGFSDAVVSWRLQENHFYINSNNGYVLFLQPNSKYLLCIQSTTNKKSKTKSRA